MTTMMIAAPPAAPLAYPMLSQASPPTASERMLLDLARRVQRQPAGLVAVLAQVSRMAGARAHHRRIARAMMEDVAQRHDGQVFALRNGDLILVCRAALQAGRVGNRPSHPADIRNLPTTLERLLRADSQDNAALIAHWSLESEPDRLVEYATTRLAETAEAPPAEEEPRGHLAAIGALAGLAEQAQAIDLIQRQTAVMLLPTRPEPGQPVDGRALRPLFTELSFHITALEARLGGGVAARTDPFLFRHLAGRMDQRMLDLLAEAMDGGGPLDPVRAGARMPAVHLNLSLPAMLSAGFASLAAGCAAAAAPLGVEIDYSDACGDADGFARARAVLAASGAMLVLDGVSHLALSLSEPWGLGADLIKLDWAARMGRLPTPEAAALEAALNHCGPSRLVLARADSEQAIRWGLARGIRRFQGRHIDAMLAAARILACPQAESCTLRQCSERARAAAPGGRVGCRNLPLLDGAAP